MLNTKLNIRKIKSLFYFNQLFIISLTSSLSSSTFSLKRYMTTFTTTSISSFSTNEEIKLNKKYTVSYITDIEGNYDYWSRLIEYSKVLTGRPGNVALKDNCGLIFGGDVCDRGIGDITIINDMVSLKERYPDRVDLILGNRDINKLRLPFELNKVNLNQAPKVYWIPDDPTLQNCNHSNSERMKWILTKTMGSPDAFENRRIELKELGRSYTDEDVAKSFVDLVNPNPSGKLTTFMKLGCIAKVIGNVLIIHGAILDYNIGWVPPYSVNGKSSIIDAIDSKTCNSLEEWVHEINKFAFTEVCSYISNSESYISCMEDEMNSITLNDKEGKNNQKDNFIDIPYRTNWAAVGGYLHPQPGSSLLQYGMGWMADKSQNPSVIYATYGTDSRDSNHPTPKVASWLKESNIRSVFVGHQPRGDCPYILDNYDVQIVSADTSYAVNALWDHEGKDDWKVMDMNELIFEGDQNILNQHPPSNSTRGAVVSETLIEVAHHLPFYSLKEPLAAKVICRGILSDNSNYEFVLDDSVNNKYVGRKTKDNWTVKASNVILSKEAIAKSNKNSSLENKYYLISSTEGFTVKNKYVHYLDIDKEFI